MILISQDGLKAIDSKRIDFLSIFPDKNSDGNFSLFVKTTIPYGPYENIILFEHENIELVKHVMRFIANGIFFFPRDDDDNNLLHVDLPELYKYGMKPFKQ